MRIRWVVLTAALTVLAACTVDPASVFDPEEDRLCTWFTDEDVSGIIDSANGGGGIDDDVFKSGMGWGCWWQTSSAGVVLAPFIESDAHPVPEEVASFPHPALSNGVSVMVLPQGDWPPQIETRTDGKNFSVLLSVEGMSQILWFSLEIPPESEVDVDTALSIADEMLNRMGWAN